MAMHEKMADPLGRGGKSAAEIEHRRDVLLLRRLITRSEMGDVVKAQKRALVRRIFGEDRGIGPVRIEQRENVADALIAVERKLAEAANAEPAGKQRGTRICHWIGHRIRHGIDLKVEHAPGIGKTAAVRLQHRATNIRPNRTIARWRRDESLPARRRWQVASTEKSSPCAGPMTGHDLVREAGPLFRVMP